MNTAQALSVVGKKSDGTIGFKQQSLLPDPHAARILTLPQTTGQPHLLTVGSDGQVREYAGWPLTEVHSFMSLSTVAGAVVGDLYGDGTQWLALCTESTIAVYNVAAGSMEWSIPFQGCTDLIAYQLDGVGAMELIIAGAKPGVVLDASDGSTRWSYPDSFGTTVAAGKLGAHGETEFVGSGNQITVFSVNPYSPLWDYSSGYYFGASGLAVTDVTGDGRADILFESSYGGIQVLDSVTQKATPLSPNGGPMPSTIAVADIDGTGTHRLIGTDSGAVYLINEASGAVIWSAISSGLPFNVMTLGDIDADGIPELLTASGSQFWVGNAGMQIRNMSTGGIEWTSGSSSNANDAFGTAPFRFVIDTQLDPSDPKIIVGGTDVYDGRLVVVDGKTHSVDVQIGYYSGNDPLDSRIVYDVILADVDGDGVDDIVAATAPDLSWTYGAKLQTFSLLGQPLWDSVGMGDYSINGVFAVPPNLGAGDELVAALPDGLRAYGRLSHLLDWTLSAPNSGALIIPSGQTAPEIAVEYNNVISFYDAASQTYLRQVTLTDPIDAVTPLDGDALTLLVSSGGRMHLIDGISGSELATTPYLGDHLAAPNQLAVKKVGSGAWLIGAGNQLGIFRYTLNLSDRVFASGFDGS